MPLIPRHIAQAVKEFLGMRFVASARAAVDVGSVAAEASGDATITVTGAALGDVVLWGLETDIITGVNAAVACFVSAADTVTIHVSNGNAAGGAAIDLASTQFQVAVLRRV